MEKIYSLRFEFFLSTQLLTLFGSLVFPSELHEEILSPIFLIAIIIAGIILISKKKKLVWLFIFFLLIEVLLFGSSFIENIDVFLFYKINFFFSFLFYSTITYEIINFVWLAKVISRSEIFALISGYISLGFIGFFIFLSVDLWYPNSFNGILVSDFNGLANREELMYFSYITLMTIGYGEITPITSMAQKSTIFVGLMGQFYLVIITAIIVGKFISQSNKNKA